MIDKIGLYLTVGGGNVRIFSIEGDSSFPCKGHILKKDSIGRTRRRFSSWQTNGIMNILPGSKNDIKEFISD